MDHRRVLAIAMQANLKPNHSEFEDVIIQQQQNKENMIGLSTHLPTTIYISRKGIRRE